ncbi:MAG: SHOCT domain-containing protein [Dehalococcoidia bacterium]|nr:SHOCT domain-containing protein [Dehalococcoidia bacterium]
MSRRREIERLAGLLERGVLTQEEFDAKKKELLGLKFCPGPVCSGPLT